MKNVLKIAGIIAVVAILVCNLEYAMVSGSMKTTPNKAYADFTNAKGHYCGSNTSDTSLRVGTWTKETSWVYNNSGYRPWYQVYMQEGPGSPGGTKPWYDPSEDGFWLFDPYDVYATECGPNIGYQCCGDTDPSTGNSYVNNPYPYPYYTTSYDAWHAYGPF
jgi:hypothetical protein